MKILHIITSLKIGGAESALYNYLSACKNKNNHYVAYFYDGPNVAKIKKLGIATFYISGEFYKYDLFLYSKLKKLIKKIKPDIIHSALWSANFISRILAKKLNIPIICDLHNEFSHNGKIRNWLEKLVIFKANKYIAVSDSAYKSYHNFIKQNYDKHSNQLISKTIKISNGIDVDFVHKTGLQANLSRKALNLDTNDFVFGTVGRLEPVKNHELLIKSFYELLKQTNKSNIKLCIIGDGSQRNSLEKLTHKLKITDRVILLGQQPNTYKYYPIFDCFVLSSQSEGMPISLLEALCFGLPVILTHKNTKHDVIENHKNGFIVPCGSQFELVRAMEKIYCSKILCAKIRTSNLNLVKEKFDINLVKKASNKLYKEILNK
ncbi:glycosyltransferase [Candidatus Dependentiae bacterium]